MTPALDLLKKVRAEHRVHSYEHDPKAASYGLEAAEKLGLAPAASLMKVFWPYITYDTVFDNSRIQKVLGHAPAHFTDYCAPLGPFA